MDLNLRPFFLYDFYMTSSAKERVFCKGLKMKKVKGAIYMDSWKLIRLLGISILHLGKAFNNQIFMYMICWHFKRIALM